MKREERENIEKRKERKMEGVIERKKRRKY